MSITIFLMVIGFTSFAQQTYVPDDHFEQYLIDQGFDTGPLDDYVPTSNMELIESFFINRVEALTYPIHDFTGIEACANLTEIILFGVPCSNLDLTANHAITQVRLIELPNLSSLTIQKQAPVDELFLWDLPLLTTLDVTNIPTLTAFDGSNLYLSKVDLTGCTNLIYLSIRKNVGVGEVQASNLPELKQVAINGESNSSLLTSVTIENNPKLKYFNIPKHPLLSEVNILGNPIIDILTITETGLESLDLTGTTGLRILNVQASSLVHLNVDGCVMLEQLNAELNQLESLNVDDCSQLFHINVQGSHLTSLRTLHNPLLRRLILIDNQLTSLNLSENPVLENLYVVNNQLRNLNMRNLNSTTLNYFFPNTNPDLTCIQVDDPNEWTLNHGTLLDPQMSFNTTCEQLTYVPDDGFEQYLIDQGYDVGPIDNYVPTANIEGVTSIMINQELSSTYSINELTGIEGFIALENLEIVGNQLSVVDLSHNSNLTTLVLDDNNLTDLNLGDNPPLEILSLSGNHLTTLDITNQNSNTEILLVNNPPMCIIVDDVYKPTLNFKDLKKTNSIHFVEDLIDCTPSPESMTYVPDDAFEQFLIDLGYDQGPLNDSVPTANIINLKSIIINKSVFNQYPIADLTGIESMVNLERLEIFGNAGQIKVLDISLNYNIFRIYIRAHTIESVELGELKSNLFSLGLIDNNLSSLDVSESSNLKFLYLQDNDIIELNIRDNYNNDNRSNLNIHLYNNPNLRCVYVQDEQNLNNSFRYFGGVPFPPFYYINSNYCNPAPVLPIEILPVLPQLRVDYCGVARVDPLKWNYPYYLFKGDFNAATQFRYEVLNTETNELTTVEGTPGTAIFFFNLMPEAFQYDTEFEIKVAALVDGDWSDYGPVCRVITPPYPTGQIKSSICGTVRSNPIYAVKSPHVNGVTNYTFEVTNTLTNQSIEVTKPFNFFTFNMVEVQPILTPNTPLNIRVKYEIDGAYRGYGEVCQVTTVSTLKKGNTTTEDTFVQAYPNPCTDILYLTGSDNSAYKVYDMMGTIVLEGDVYNGEINTSRLTHGKYILKLINHDGVNIQTIIKN